MEEHTNSSLQTSTLESTMEIVRKTADMNLAYFEQVQADIQHTRQISERILRMKRQDLALLTNRFHTSLEKKAQIASRMLGDFCTMVVLHEWVTNANHDARDEYLLCLDLLFEAHEETFAWANNPVEEPHPAGGRLRCVPVEEQYMRINIHASSKTPVHTQVESKDIDDPFIQGLNDIVSEAEEMAASNRRIEAIIDLIESISFSYGETSETISGTFHARRLASSMKLHQMKPSLVEANSSLSLFGGDE